MKNNADLDYLIHYTLDSSEYLKNDPEKTVEILKNWRKIVNLLSKNLAKLNHSKVRTVTTYDENKHPRTVFENEMSADSFGISALDFETVLPDINKRLNLSKGGLQLQKEIGRIVPIVKGLSSVRDKEIYKKVLTEIGGEVRFDEESNKAFALTAVKNSTYRKLLGNYNYDTKKVNAFVTKIIENKIKNKEKELLKEKKDEERRSKKAEKGIDEFEVDDKSKEKSKKESAVKRMHIAKALGTVGVILVTILDIVRRILTATLTRATEVNKEMASAKSLGLSYEQQRQFGFAEQSRGLPAGTITNGISSLQQAFGNITALDENALSELAKVLQGDVIQAINQGLGKSDPALLMETILDTYFKRGQQGINSIGQYVGKERAERELASSLEKTGFSALAEVLRSMFYTNDVGTHKDQVSNFQDYTHLTQRDTMGILESSHKIVRDLGQTMEELKARFDNLKKNLTEELLVSLSGFVAKVNDLNFGRTLEEKLSAEKGDRENLEKARDNLEQKAVQAKQLYTEAFNRTEFKDAFWAMAGYVSPEEFFHTLSAENVNKEEIQPLLHWLRNTNEGNRVLSLATLEEKYNEKVKQAKNEIQKGKETGTFTYDPVAYSDYKIQQEVNDSLLIDSKKARSKMTKIEVLNGISQNKSGRANIKMDGGVASWVFFDPYNARTADETDIDTLYNAYTDIYGTPRFNEIVDMENPKNSKDLLIDFYRWQMGFTETDWKKERQESKFKGADFEDYVINNIMKGYENDVLIDKDFEDYIAQSLKNGDAGVSKRIKDLLLRLIQQRKQTNFIDIMSAQQAINEAILSSNLSTELSRYSSASATVKAQGDSGKVEVVIKAKNEKGDETIIYKDTVDNALQNKNTTLSFDLSSLTDNARINGGTN